MAQGPRRQFQEPNCANPRSGRANLLVEAKKNERANALKEVKRLCKEFGFTAGMLKGSLAEGRKKK